MPDPSPFRFCLVTNELGTHAQSLADALTKVGWAVHVLYCGSSAVRKKQKFSLWQLNDSPAAAVDETWSAAEQLSGRIYVELNRLNQLYEFQLVEFIDGRSNGFRSVQAKRLGVAFAAATLAVRAPVDSWCGDFSERFSFEQADLQISPTRHRLTFLREQGAAVRENARVVPYLLPPPEPGALAPGVNSKAEVVFFAPLEIAEGLKLFIEAVKELPLPLSLTFLGEEGYVNGKLARNWIKETLPGRPIKVLSDLPRAEALAYLKKGNRLAVIPTPADTYPFTLVDCAINGIPFLASNAGEIAELIDSPALARQLLFAPDPADLRRCLTKYLKSEYTVKSLLRLEVSERFAREENLARVLAEYSALPLLLPASPVDMAPTPEPLTFARFREARVVKPGARKRLFQEIKQALKAFRKIRN